MSTGDVEDIYELSPLQQGVLFHTLYDGGSDIYVNQRTFLIEGPLDVEALLKAWMQSIDVHPVLRTSFHWEGLDKPLQVVHPSVQPVVRRYDWSDIEDQQVMFDGLLADDLDAGFDPALPPLQRLSLVRLGENRYKLIWTHHLLLLDGWSVPIFINDVMRRYVSITVGGSPPPTPAPYRDYIAWLQQQDMAAAKEFWMENLDGRADVTSLAPLRAGDPRQPPGPIGSLVVDLGPRPEADLRSLAARHSVTLSTVLQAAWALLLQRYSGDQEVTFGVTSSCRPPELPGVDQMVGLFTNTLPVRLPVPADGDVGAWLRDIQARYTAVRRYEYTPLAQIKQWVGATGSRQLFDTLVVFDNYSLALEADGLDQRLVVKDIEVVEKTTYPIVLTVTPEPSFALRLYYHRERLADTDANEILTSFQATLAGLVDAERIAPVAVGLEREVEQQNTTVPYADAGRTLSEMIERQADATPDAVALLSDDESVRYGDLLSRARDVAAALTTTGVGPGHVVGVCAQRSADMVIALLGTLLAGAAYLPLEPSLPAARLAFMARDAGITTVLAQREVARLAYDIGAPHILLLEDLPQNGLGFTPTAVHPHDTAYVLYTSGSTGKPKGVAITHAAIVNRLLWMQDTFQLCAEDRVLQKTPIGFDVSVWELFWPLITGATLVLARPDGHQDAAYLARTIARQAVTVAHFVPSMLQLFLDEPAITYLPSLRQVMCSGESLTPALVDRFHRDLRAVELHNLYGPTETAVDVTWWDCARPAPPAVVPIGDPVANTTVHVLDHRLLQVPTGVPGELYVGGVQLARGYRNRSGLTADRFVAHRLAGSGGRLYRTGDRVRRLPDGSLQYLGRLDRQVKLHGYRIELDEIEQALSGHPAVRDAAVVVQVVNGGPRLAAYLTTNGPDDLDTPTLRSHLQGQLPSYMLPATFTVLPAIPRTHNGKLDRAALPQPTTGKPARDATPTTLHEELVATAFREVLSLEDIDVSASFFDLGGNSFDAVRAIRRIEGASVGLLVAHPSVRQLAKALAEQECGDRLLLRLSKPGPISHNLVCVPFAGGSAVTYQPLARELPPEIGLHAVALPGHEVGGDAELRPLEEVAADCAKMIDETINGPISVYGHCAGVALAVELVRCLEEAGRPVERLFVAGSYPFYEPGPAGRVFQRAMGYLVTHGMLRVSTLTVGLTTDGSPTADTAEMRFLQSEGGFDGDIDSESLAFVMRAFRHDVAEAPRYFAARGPRRTGTPVLTAPITFIAGTCDPFTPHYQRRGRLWERFSPDVDIATVPYGGHYFHQHEPVVVAKIIEQKICASERSTPSCGDLARDQAPEQHALTRNEP